MEKQAYNISETAKIMGVCKSTVEKLIRDGQLYAKRPSPRRVLVSADSIKTYLNDRP